LTNIGIHEVLQTLAVTLPAIFLPPLAPDPLHAHEQLAMIDLLEMPFEELINLDIISAGKQEQKIKDIPASIEIVTRKEIENYGYADLEDILKNVVGMYTMDEFGFYGKTFGIRGYWASWPRNMVFLLNGVPQTEGIFYNHIAMYVNVPVEAIDRIEIVKGPMSAMYGSGAFFGVVNIITNDFAGDLTPANQVSASYGSLETYKGAARLTGVEGETSYALNFGYHQAAGPDEPLSRMVSDLSTVAGPPYNIDDTNNTTTDRLELETKHLSLSLARRGFYTNISFDENANEYYSIGPSYSDGNLYTRNLTKISVGYKKQLADNFSVDGVLTYHDTVINIDYDYLADNFFARAAANSEIYEAELRSYYTFSPELDITTGLVYQVISGNRFLIDHHNFPIQTDQQALDDIKSYAFFSQANYSVNDALRLVAGVRLEKQSAYPVTQINFPGSATSTEIQGTYEHDDLDMVGNLAAIYSFNRRNIFKLLYGKAVNRPAFFNNVAQIAAGRPDLEPEYIQTLELNYIATPLADFALQASIFHNELDNLTSRVFEYDSATSTYISYYANAGKMETNGVELILQMKPFADFQAQLGATWQDTQDKRDGFEDITVEYSPNFLGYLKASYHYANYVISLTGNYVDEMETHWNVEKVNPDGSRGGRVGDKVEDYVTLDANLRVNDLFNKNYYLNLKIANLFDQEYLYPVAGNNSAWADKGTPGGQRFFLATIGRKF